MGVLMVYRDCPAMAMKGIGVFYISYAEGTSSLLVSYPHSYP